MTGDCHIRQVTSWKGAYRTPVLLELKDFHLYVQLLSQLSYQGCLRHLIRVHLKQHTAAQQWLYLIYTHCSRK